jgi:hypothetical protein
MPKYLLVVACFILLLCGKGYAQDDFEKWNQNYAAVDLLELLKSEQQYADSIEAVHGKEEYYYRAAKYRFAATYQGLKRRIDPKVLRSMKNVLGMVTGNAGQLDDLVENEYLFQVGEVRFWAPMQRQLEEPFAEEVRSGESVLLYCLFLNEHSSSGLYNTFLVSEFLKE